MKKVFLVRWIIFFAGIMIFSSAAPVAVADQSGQNELLILDFIKIVAEKNERLIAQHEEWQISRQVVVNSKSIFEPLLVASYTREESKIKNTAEQTVSLFFAGPNALDSKKKLQDYRVSMEGLTPYGSRLRLGYTQQIIATNFNKAIGQEVITFFGVSLIQPLLKGFGKGATLANIKVAEADSDIAFQTVRQQTMQLLFNAAGSFWDLLLAQEKVKIRSSSVSIAQKILVDNIKRFQLGRMAETEVVEASAGVALRKSLLAESEQTLISALNTAATFASMTLFPGRPRVLVALGSLEIDDLKPDLDASLNSAFKYRPEYIATKIKIDRENVRVIFAKNQKWPQLDLKASYGKNGLSIKGWKSFMDMAGSNYPVWSAGIEFKMPLGGRNKGKSELKAARHRKKQALLEFISVERAITNVVASAIDGLAQARRQVILYKEVEELNARLLETEMAMLKAGKRTSRNILEKEEFFNRAREARLESAVKYKKAILGLKIADGTLLKYFGIKIEEGERK